MRKIARTLTTTAFVIAAVATGLFWNYEVVPVRGSFISEAHAIIGRPLTPMSYAGVARRTVRRCAVGVYYC